MPVNRVSILDQLLGFRPELPCGGQAQSLRGLGGLGRKLGRAYPSSGSGKVEAIAFL